MINLFFKNMNFVKDLYNKNKLLFWVLGGITTLVSFYADWFKKDRPKIVYDIISNETIVDLKEKVSNIDILYKGQSILKDSQNLSLLVLRVFNDGNRDVVQNDYDAQIPFGFSVINGYLVENPSLTETSNAYLSDRIKLIVDSTGSIGISKAILEEDEGFSLKVLIQHGQNTIPTIQPVGKIAGVESFILKESYKEPNNKGWANSILNFLKTAAFFLLFGVIVFIIIYYIDRIFVFFKKKKKRKKISMFQALYPNTNNEYNWVLEEYEKGYIDLKDLEKSLRNSEYLSVYIPMLEYVKNKKDMHVFEDFYYINFRNETILALKEKNIIRINGDNHIEVDAEFLNFLISFNAFASAN